MKKILIDTDVLLDLLEKREPEYQALASILSNKDKLKLKIHFTTLSMFKVQQRLSESMSTDDCRQVLRRIAQLGKVISPDDKTFRKAMNATFTDLDFSIQYYTADDFHMDYILSNKPAEKKNRKMPVLRADQFLLIT
jgi:predicted nucleic acid-binding protein